MKHLRTLHKYFFRYRKQFLIGIICTFIANYLSILAPQVTGFVIDRVSTQNATTIDVQKYNFLVRVLIRFLQTTQGNFALFILYATLLLLLLAVLRGLFMFVMRQTIIVGSRHIEYDLKNDIYRQYQSLDLSFYKKNHIGDLMNRISEDVSKVRMYVGPAVMYVINMLVLLVLSVYFMFDTNPTLALISLSPLPFLAYVIYHLNTKIQRGSELAQQELSGLTTLATETYSGIRVIQSFVQERNRYKVFERQAKAYQDRKMHLAQLESFYFPSMTFLIGVSTLLTIAVGGVLVVTKSIPLAVIVEFVMYINMLIFPVSSIGWIISIIQSAAASQKRINEFMHIMPVINKPHPMASRPVLNGDIIFEKVDFTYQQTGIHAIKDFSLSISQGAKVALMGRMASGKSSIAQLLVRAFDYDKGKILLSGEEITHIDLNYLRDHISYVSQESYIFSDTVRNNLCMVVDTPVTEEQLIAITKVACLYEEIQALPHKWDTLLGERGINLSGGQKQRLALARALMKPKPIYIFDDSFSAIDKLTEKKIIHNLSTMLRTQTMLFITHNVYETMPFDQIVVLADGKIVETGTHESLMQERGVYYSLYMQQYETQTVSSF